MCLSAFFFLLFHYHFPSQKRSKGFTPVLLALGSIPPRNHQYMKHMAPLLVFFSWGCSWDESTI